VGHSLGGAAVLVAASKLDEVKAVATVGAPAHVDHVKHLFEKDLNEGGIEGRAKVSIGGRPFEIDEHFVEELSKTNLLEVVKSLRKPLLILHSPTDRTVGVENAEQIYRAAHHPKSFVTLDKADHLLSDGKDSRYVGQMVGAWVQRYFDQEPEEELRTEGHQLVGHLNLIEDNFTTSIQMPNHALIADEPEHIGGDDLGPAPYDLMLSGLAACTVMTLKMYAARKEWDLQEAYVYLDYSKKHSDELEIEVEKPGQVDFIAKELRLIGDLTAEQKERLKQISAKCPVHRTLTSQVVFETSIID